MRISYEFFPPADLDFNRVASHFNELKGFQPTFLSVTFGAGGSPEDKSLGLIKELQKKKTKSQTKIPSKDPKQ